MAAVIYKQSDQVFHPVFRAWFICVMLIKKSFNAYNEFITSEIVDGLWQI